MKTLVRQLIGSSGIPKYILGTSDFARTAFRYLESACGGDGRIKGFINEISDIRTFEGLPVIHRLEDLEMDAIVLNTLVGIAPVTMKRRLGRAGIRNVDFFSFIRESGFPIEIPFWSGFRESYASRREEYDLLADRLSDEESRQVYADLMDFRLNYNLEAMERYSVRPTEQYFEPFLHLGEKEVFCDIGGYVGDTTEEFIRRCPGFRKIWFFEPEPSLMSQAKKRLQAFGDIVYAPFAASDRSGRAFFDSSDSSSRLSESGDFQVNIVRIDDVVDSQITYLKMDIEGSESKALSGARETILRYHPRLAVCVYHNGADYIDIPKQVLSIRDDYDLYLRHYTEGVTETVMYFIPHKETDE